ncbi:PorT family protein [Hymenobacter aerilatus]|uniref:PorT family protein n=1 Tax=Hymenobacter aerilatus TaxID=2932251 RepID=A0A8T9T0V0_9BACT|nr:porin family protein [Hymenobacter aerilatus]UOR05669.1 PorT family protein [Hymenobacter aerilatus]
MADSTKQVVFLEVVVSGPVSLFYMRDRNGTDLLYLRNVNSELQALTQTTERIERDGARYDQKDNAFQRTLAAALVACPAVQPSLSRLAYTTRAIANVVRQYNRCVNGGSHEEAASTEKPISLAVAVMAGGTGSQLRFVSDVNYANTSIRSGLVPVGGVAAHLWLPGLNKHLAVRLEALYMANTTYKNTYEGQEDMYTVYRETYAQLSSIRVPVLLRYSWPGKRIQPFVQIGVSGSYLLNSKNETRYRYLNRAAFPDYYPWRAIIEQPRKFEQGAIGSIGLSVLPASKHAINVELRYERTNGFSDAYSITTRLAYYSLLMSYNLTKQAQ